MCGKLPWEVVYPFPIPQGDGGGCRVWCGGELLSRRKAVRQSRKPEKQMGKDQAHCVWLSEARCCGEGREVQSPTVRV